MITLYATLILLVFSNICFGQITTTKVAESKPIEIDSYDSLKNFLGSDFKKYIGQQLYLIPKSESLRQYGYEGFIIDYNKSSFDQTNTFKCCDSYHSKYEDLQGKYFSVLDAFDDPKSSYSSDAYLKLKLNDSGEEVFYKFNKKYEFAFPFLVVGFFEKQKEIFVNQEVLIRPFPKIEGLNQKTTNDITTGEEIEFIKGEYVKCIDITIDEKYYDLSLLLVNAKGQQFLFDLNSRFLNICRIYTRQEAELLSKKFGEENWQTIRDEEIKVGFSEEMIKVSWGEPDKINRSSYGDQWVYGNQYLYFENGKLKSYN